VTRAAVAAALAAALLPVERDARAAESPVPVPADAYGVATQIS
jgi:hypothetical protein